MFLVLVFNGRSMINSAILYDFN